MKLTAFLIIFVIGQMMASETYSQATKLTFQLKDATLKEVLAQIEEKSEFFFLYNSKLVDVNRKVSVDVKNQRIDDLLTQLFPQDEVAFIVVDRQIILSPKQDAYKFEMQQQRITGTVTDAGNGEPIVGANIVVEGTTIGVISDANGKYTIDVPGAHSVLTFSFIGYISEKIQVSGQSNIDIKLAVDITNLEEIVVVGYGTVKKSDLTGSIASIARKDLGDRQVSDISMLIQGKAAGVDVTAGTIRIRGVTTFNNTDPLFVVDGFIGGNLNSINADDIENIEILKDASSTAIYGTKGANGVILVTTKNGKAGSLKVNINAFTGIATTPKKLPVLNASDYVDYMIDAATNANLAISSKMYDPATRTDVTNWQDEVFRTARRHEVNMNFSGGTEKGNFYLSLGYRYNDGITIGPSYNNVFVTLKNNFKIKSWLRAGTNFSLNYGTGQGLAPIYQNGIRPMISMPPYMPVTDPSVVGGYSNVDRSADMTDIANPVAIAMNSHPESKDLSYQANIWTEIEPLKGLVYRLQSGVSGNFYHGTRWDDTYLTSGNMLTYNKMSENAGYGFYPTIEGYLTYSKKFGMHDLSAMVGHSWQNYQINRNFGISGQNFENPNVHNVFNGLSNQVDYENVGKYASLSYFGRLNYQLDNKYLLTFNFRNDGSPRFASQNRWAFFPSLSLAWKLHEENFMKNQGIFDQLKLHGSWGINGNDQIGDFLYTSQVYTTGVFYPIGTNQDIYHGATVLNNYSPDIKWESTESTSFGADMAFLRNKLTLSLEYFIKDTRDILFTVPRPYSMGYGGNFGGDATVNAASCRNKGFEIQTGFKSLIGNLHYSIDANYTFINNNVISLGQGQPYLNSPSRTDVGHSIGYFYGYKADGIFQTQSEVDIANEAAREAYLAAHPGASSSKLQSVYYQNSATAPGDVRFKDLNADGTITDKDRTELGNAIPKHYYGVNINLTYKGFDFNAGFQGIAGSKIYWQGVYTWTRFGTYAANQESRVLDRWRSPSDPGNGVQPRAMSGDSPGNTRASDLHMEDGSYLKLRQISLGYSIPATGCSKIGVERLRVYASAYNILTITKSTLFDPEISGSNLYRGIDNGGDYPMPKSFVIGLQLGL